jgi:hypothetical protein
VQFGALENRKNLMKTNLCDNPVPHCARRPVLRLKVIC